MIREEIISILTAANSVGSVKHTNYERYTQVVSRRKKVDGAWVEADALYMDVAGRLKMANDDHAESKATMTFAPPVVLCDSADALTLMVMITSSIYGTRHGIATSRRKAGSPAEKDFPWETAETSAIGRALGAMGYGLLPDAGLASAEDLQRASGGEQSQEPHPRAESSKSNGAPRPKQAQAGSAAIAYFDRADAAGFDRKTSSKVLTEAKGNVTAAESVLKAITAKIRVETKS